MYFAMFKLGSEAAPQEYADYVADEARCMLTL